MKLSIFFTLTDNKFNQLIKKMRVLIKSRVNITVRVSSTLTEYTVCQLRCYYAGFTFASSVGSGRVLFNQTVYSVQSIGFSVFLGQLLLSVIDIQHSLEIQTEMKILLLFSLFNNWQRKVNLELRHAGRTREQMVK